MSLKRIKKAVRKRKHARYSRFEQWISNCEQEAFNKYQFASLQAEINTISSRLERYLHSKIIPGLKQIGFEESIALSIFQIAAPAWETMNPVGEGLLWLNPGLITDLEEVRAGVLQKATSTFDKTTSIAEEDDTLSEQRFDPAYLWQSLNDISTSWIILPRAYLTLKHEHSNAITGYIKFLFQENNSEFKKILARVITEYVANFTSKFITEKQQHADILDVVFYGYAAMFWRNIANPPEGYEDCEIFLNFFRWATMVSSRTKKITPQRSATLAEMVYAVRTIFPKSNAFNLCRKEANDLSSFLIALRHGQVGVNTVHNYFGTGGKLLPDATNASIPFNEIPQKLSRFFRLIRQRIHLEKPKTKKSVQDFLGRLKADFEHFSSRLKSQGRLSRYNELHFATRRIVGLILQSELTNSLTENYRR